MNKSAEMVVTERYTLADVKMRLILGNPCTYSLKETGALFKTFYKLANSSASWHRKMNCTLK
jgi:hypothetical protein